MKMPRFFIAFALAAGAFTAGLLAEGSCLPVSAGPLPIVRVDPRAGDPDEPAGGYSMPFMEEAADPTATNQPVDYRTPNERHRSWLEQFLRNALANLFEGRR